MADRHDEAYKEGYYAGKDAGWLDDMVHNGCYDTERGRNSRTDQSYHAGYNDGLADSNDSSNSHYSGGSSSDSDGGGVCFVTSACVFSKGLPDDCLELETLRKFRNEYVLKMSGGVELNDEYKRIAPKIVENINKRSNSTEIYDGIYSEITCMVDLINEGKNSQALDSYKNMVGELADMYNL